jgi:hypothetical protein
MNNLASFVMRNPDACFTYIPPDEIVVLNSEDHCFYCLNESAVDLWLALETPQTSLALAQALIDKYEGEDGVYEQDVLEWIDDMKEKGLLLSADSEI